MVVPAGGAWLAVHVLLLLAAKPSLVTMALTSSWTGDVSDNVTDYVSWDQQQADMPQPQAYYRGQGMKESGQTGADSMLADDASNQDRFHIEDIQVGCRELRAKRYISDGFCTSTKPIKEVVCAGHCLPIKDLPWYAEFVKIWAKSKLRQWQCEEDIVRRKSVHLLCRNGEYRTYRIKVVKSCKCKRTVAKHNRTVSSDGKKKKKRRKDKKRRGKRRRKGERKVRRRQGEEQGVVSQTDQRQKGSKEGKDRKRQDDKKTNTNSDSLGGQIKTQNNAKGDDSDMRPALSDPSS